MAEDPSRCPSPEDLERLVGDELGDADLTAVEAHIETCAVCQDRLERLAAPTAPLSRPPSVPPPAPEPDEAFMDRLRQLPLPSTGTASAAPHEATAEHVPSHLGPYEILGRLGRGGMGTVYRARHRELDKVVALKVLPADRVDEAAVARFRNEMKAAGRLGHPNIVAALDAGRADGTYYLAMDFVDGLDLSRVVERLGPLPIPDACELIRQAAVGLQHACECGLAHRDVKPSNLMLARGGVVKVLDLGLARSLADLPAEERLTATGVVLGTADYIAPEQIDRAHTADARSDVYGLGGTLYFLLAGAPPFGDRPSWLEKLRAHVEAPVPPVRQRRPEVPAALAALLERMLAKDPADRPATPGEVAEEMRPFAAGADPDDLLTRAGRATPADRPAPPETHTVGPRGRRGAAARYALAAAAGAAAALLVVLPFLGPRRGQSPQTPAGGAPAPQPAGLAEGAEAAEAVRLTFGPLGPTRPDNRVLPGEEVCVEFSVPGIATDPDGRVDITLRGELVDEQGQTVQKLLPVPFKNSLALGGATFSGLISFDLPGEFPAGTYRVRAVVADRIAMKDLTVEHPIRVLTAGFGAVGLRFASDRKGTNPAGGHLTVGQQLFLVGRAVGFARKDGHIHVAGSISLRDSSGNTTTPAPVTFAVDQKVTDDLTHVSFDFSLFANRPGTFTIAVELRDLIGQKTAAYELPVVIHPPPHPIRPPGKER
jgi:hypothetical protein